MLGLFQNGNDVEISESAGSQPTPAVKTPKATTPSRGRHFLHISSMYSFFGTETSISRGWAKGGGCLWRLTRADGVKIPELTGEVLVHLGVLT
jgi:hypothetical protein